MSTVSNAQQSENKIKKFRMLQHPITKKPIRLPLISPDNPLQVLQDSNPLDETNMFLQEPHRALMQVIKYQNVPTEYLHKYLEDETIGLNPKNPDFVPLESSPTQIDMKIKREPEYKIILSKLSKQRARRRSKSRTLGVIKGPTREPESRNSYYDSNTGDPYVEKAMQEMVIVSKQLKKFRPQNSSMTTAYDASKEPRSHSRKRVSLKSLSPLRTLVSPVDLNSSMIKVQPDNQIDNNQVLAVNTLLKGRTAQKTDGRSCGSSKAKLEAIIYLYDKQKRTFQKMRQQRNKIQKGLTNAYGQIQSSVRNNLYIQSANKTHYTAEEEVNANQRAVLKKEVEDLSRRCEIIARSTRKK